VQEAVFVQSRAVAGAHHQRQALDVNHEYSIAATITHGPDGASTGLEGEEAVRQIDFGDW
jgi:hypothetical protein